MPSPHLNIEHMVEVDGVRFASVNGSYMDRNELSIFFTDVAKNQQMAYIDVVVDDGANERQWTEVKSQIEHSGACASNFCIDGYKKDPLPAERLKAN